MNGAFINRIIHFVGSPKNRPFEIRIHQAARRGRECERITNFKTDTNEPKLRIREIDGEFDVVVPKAIEPVSSFFMQGNIEY